jgi:hypothetical protein
MMETTKIYHALKGVRGRKAVDLMALEKLMVGFSQLVGEQRWIKEIDINPLFASANPIASRFSPGGLLTAARKASASSRKTSSKGSVSRSLPTERCIRVTRRRSSRCRIATATVAPTP